MGWARLHWANVASESAEIRAAGPSASGCASVELIGTATALPVVSSLPLGWLVLSRLALAPAWAMRAQQYLHRPPIWFGPLMMMCRPLRPFLTSCVKCVSASRETTAAPAPTAADAAPAPGKP
jgi:hypothetical protein